MPLMIHVAKIQKRWHIQYHLFKKLIEFLHNSRKNIKFASEMKKILG